MPRVTENQIKKALFVANGVLSVAADSLNVARQTLYNRIEKNEKLQNYLHHVRERTIDYAESKMIQHMKSTDGWLSFSASKYYLSTMGKSRGYSLKDGNNNDAENNDLNLIYQGPDDN